MVLQDRRRAIAPPNLLSFNGQSPGPRLEVRPGDTVRIRLHNQLDQSHPT